MLILLPYLLRQKNPEVGRHVRRVNQRVEAIDVDLVAEVLQHRQMGVYVVEIERHESTRLAVFHHTDGAAGIEHQNGNFFVALHENVFLRRQK